MKWLHLSLSIESSDVRGPPWSVLVAWGWSNITQHRKITKKIVCSSQTGAQQRLAVMICTALVLVLSPVHKRLGVLYRLLFPVSITFLILGSKPQLDVFLTFSLFVFEVISLVLFSKTAKPRFLTFARKLLPLPKICRPSFPLEPNRSKILARVVL